MAAPRPRAAPVHLDAASGEPPLPEAVAAWHAAVADGWADPARLYGRARRARLLLDTARESVAAVLGAAPDEVSFVPTLPYALTVGVLGMTSPGGGPADHGHVVTSAVEHSAVLHAVREHERRGGTATVLPVDAAGRVDAGAVAAELRARAPVRLLALQAANGEVGTRQPLAEVLGGPPARGVPVLVDASTVVGRLPVPRGWSLLAAAAREWGSPAPLGVLAVRRGMRWRPPLPGDGGTPVGGAAVPGPPDVPAVVAAATALETVVAGAARESARLHRLVARLRAEVPRRVPDVDVVGDPDDRLPHLLTFSVLYLPGDALVSALDAEGLAVASGSACTSDVLEPSHVLAAMGALTHGNLRVSLPRGTSEADVERFLDVLPRVVSDLRARLGAPTSGAP